MTTHGILFAMAALALLCLAQSAPPIAPVHAAEKTTAAETDLGKLPQPVRKMHNRILEAARSGDIEALRPVLESNELMPNFSFGGATDPIAFWRETSGDRNGREILAALVDILMLPYVKLRAGTSDEMYIWPYLHEADLEKLTPREEVDLYRLMSPEEAKTMREFGSYIWYRVGIGRDGTWHFFVAGD